MVGPFYDGEQMFGWDPVVNDRVSVELAAAQDTIEVQPSVMDLDDSLEVLRSALIAAGMPPWTEPDSVEPIERLEAEIAPLRLPTDVVRFWRQVDVNTLAVEAYPELNTPEFALTSWEMCKREFAAFQPLILVRVGYQSHACLSVELDSGDVSGGPLFDSFISDPTSGFKRVADSLPAWLVWIAATVRRGSHKRVQWGHIERLRLEGVDGETPPVSTSHPVHGAVTHIGGDILEWPERWQLANGLHEEDKRLRGATHTIEEALASDPGSELHATLVGRVVDLMGVGGWTRVRVADGTGRIDIGCPPEASLLGPAVGAWYEFEVVIPAGERRTPFRRASEAPDAGDAPVTRVAQTLYARYGGAVGATAKWVRRIETPPGRMGP
jgi:hypothetical protein